MTSRDATLVVALVLLAVGVFRDVARSAREKGAPNGPLGGTLRPVSWGGFIRGLPWYVAGGLLLAVVAWGDG
ncbi:hypothetical protein OO014_03430 [Intrasporangium calvum]|uniref:Uncharacterized protein n=1 Tax=Intrasporangium calvum TaxID=53358 RepID=A0ABT5GEQ3_9MICO|nr:hypothetical protein [Intrasporangium calvum]MDC5696295.1 hypothetical protein [Intrasporangium calvum]